MKRLLIEDSSFRFGGKVQQVTMLFLSDFSPVSKVVSKLIQAVHCEGVAKPCGECLQCKTNGDGSFRGSNYYDARDGISKEQVLQIKSLASLSGASASKPVIFIIDGIDRFNASSANTLLKFLEEPSENVYFILLTRSIAKTLPTVVSRSSVFRVGSDRKAFEEEIFSFTSDSVDRLVLANACTDSFQARKVFSSGDYVTLKNACGSFEKYAKGKLSRPALIETLKSLSYPLLTLCQNYLANCFLESKFISKALSVDLTRNPLRILVADRFADALSS